MGELIRWEAAASPLEFSGERLTASAAGQVQIEHYHRYLLAREFCRGKEVLDVASGEGYGSAILAQVARSVIGVEIDAATVVGSRKEFPRANLRFEQGDAQALPLPSASFDVVVSFETLEHLPEQDRFLAELRRVLRPGGLLIISTPDRDIYSPTGMAPNPHHVRELTRTEFEKLLRSVFPHAVFATQRALIGSVIIGPGNTVPARSYERRGQSHIEGSEHLSRAPYLVGLASDAELPPLPNSVYIHRSDIDTDPEMRHTAELGWQMAEAKTGALRAQITALQVREAELVERIGGLHQEQADLQEKLQNMLRQRDTAALNLEAQIEKTGRLLREAEQKARHSLQETERQLQATIRQLEARCEAEIAHHHATQHRLASEAAVNQSLQAQLHSIRVSSVWRATEPVRQFGTRYPAATRAIRQTARFAWRTASLRSLRRWEQSEAAISVPVLRADAGALGTADMDRDEIEISSSPNPTVSVIITTYGQVAYTIGCLRSIAAHPPRWPIEVIVVDDAYDGLEDLAPLTAVQGIQFRRNPVNLGFLRSCNAAAAAANGRYLLMLNNDTEPRPGAIDSLADLLDARPDIGMAGSKLLFPDGRLQEAGGILWQDASGWNYGRGEDPSRPEFNYLREVDYCSGASIMVRRELFEALGRFDEAFAPAYYEDADLAFRIRAQGQKVVYEPRSEVLHYEGMSHGTDTDSGIKAHQVTNCVTMIERWGETLANENYPSGEHVLRARDRARNRKVILVVDHYVPEPDRDAGSRSILGIIDSVVDAGWVVKFWPHNRAYSPVYTTALERRGIEVLDGRWPGSFREWMEVNGAELDQILLVRPDIAADTLPHVLGARALISFYGVDLHFARLRRHLEIDASESLALAADRMERMERRIWRQCDIVIYPSEEEAVAVRALEPAVDARAIVPFCFDPQPARTVPVKARSILFVAGFAHPPNVDAAYFLVRAILPKLELVVGPVTITMAGSNPTDAVRALTSPRVEVTGYVTDEVLAEMYAQHRVSVVPLRFGAGVKGKVVESLSRGLPVVTTSVGAQGIEGLRSVVPVHDEADLIADALRLLLTDDAAWMAQSARQMAFAQERFSPAAMRRSVLAALDSTERIKPAATLVPA
jgi:GT2 family glycosyltransferase/SAM-dependent methyltransferase/glycosyltransferase involved in cell wall biosynthesis